MKTLTRPPKKYLDRARTEVNPAWVDWREEGLEELAFLQGSGQHEVYYPEQYGKAIPEDGAWIRVLIEPQTELMDRFRVPLLSMWRARPFALPGGIAYHGLRRQPQQAVIETPGGTLHLWPFEYQVVEDITAYVGQEPDVVMHRLDGSPALGLADERMFYLMSRGISQHDAALLLLGEETSQHFVWFEMAPEYVDLLGGVGQPLWYHIATHPRSETADDPE